ncbi:MAG TPA: phosphoribosylanthranilate isomerase [Terriglobia bacterium]|nr:phosphoribosylanthranilate isomerase [Terriglobia bacterium]
MPTRVKICGITRLEDAELAVELGAAALGFNFYPPSPRYIEPKVARAIIQRLPPLVMAVGVFADETDVTPVLNVATEAGVGALQLDGPVGSSVSNGTEVFGRFPVLITVRVGLGFEPRSLGSLGASAVLLDTFHPDRRGGTGTTFDWNLAREARAYAKIILSGGLTPENVGEAVRAVRPFAVDVASGVERSPGIKEPAKLRAFLRAVAEADSER